MSKVYVQTWYRGNNYGSVLQAYALPEYIRSCGFECETLAYMPNRVKHKLLMVINRSYMETINYKINAWKMKKNHGACLEGKNLTLFDTFRAEHMKITKRCANKRQIEKVTGKDAVFVCGSDQIWNPYFYDPYYYLEYVKDKRRKIAYAPSFGVRGIPGYARKRITRALNGFDMISVREHRGSEIIKELTGKYAKVNADPTLLLDMKQWDGLAKDPEEKKPYLFCYFLSENSAYMEAAKEIAKKNGLEIRMLPMVAKDYSRGEIIRTLVGPCEWLGYVKNADYVLTDSFHCTLFAMRWKKQFAALQRFRDSDVRGQNERVTSVLNAAGLGSRFVLPEKSAELGPVTEEDYKNAEHVLGEFAESSRKWLAACLAGKESL